jgi:hypothetical protein
MCFIYVSRFIVIHLNMKKNKVLKRLIYWDGGSICLQTLGVGLSYWIQPTTSFDFLKIHLDSLIVLVLPMWNNRFFLGTYLRSNRSLCNCHMLCESETFSVLSKESLSQTCRFSSCDWFLKSCIRISQFNVDVILYMDISSFSHS